VYLGSELIVLDRRAAAVAVGGQVHRNAPYATIEALVIGRSAAVNVSPCGKTTGVPAPSSS
jgi:hypothetical protein